MTTRLDRTLKRELTFEGRAFIVAISPDGIKITLKGHRKGQELRWSDLVSGDAALAVALNASVGKFAEAATPAAARPAKGPVAAKVPAAKARRSNTSKAVRKSRPDGSKRARG